ncbi:MAG: WG repeat-containing protein [Prevotella sp.]|nr:WG repeat-containing protein [Prevotella sp.]
MRKALSKNLFVIVAVSALFVSCSYVKKMFPGEESKPAVEVVEDVTPSQLEYIPFKSSEDSKKWGLMGLDGTVLLSDTLVSEPSNAVGGLFLMRNANGLWEYFTAEAEPKKVGGEYRSAGLFYEDVAPCVEKGKDYIQFIHKDGSVAFELKDVDGAKVDWVGRFHDGLAPFKAGHLIGYVDTHGKVAIKPQFLRAGRFSEGYALVVDTAKGNDVAFRDSAGHRVSIITVDGNLLETSFMSTDSIGDRVSEGLIVSSEAPIDTIPRLYKFVDPMGNTIVPEHEDYLAISNMSGTHFAFYNGTAWGIADNQATVKLTPRYDKVVAITNVSVVACLYGKYKFLDFSDMQISKSFDEIISLEDGSHFIGRRGEKWYMLDEIGTAMGEGVYNMVFNPGADTISR